MEWPVRCIHKLTKNNLNETQERIVVILLSIICIILALLIGWGDQMDNSQQQILHRPAINPDDEAVATSAPPLKLQFQYGTSR